MRRAPRRLLGAAFPLVLFGAALYPAYIAEWYAMRELFRLSVSLGILTPTGSFWGQIYGLNIPKHSDAFHLLVRFTSVAATFAPLMVASMLLWYWIGVARPWNVRRWKTLRRAAMFSIVGVLVLVVAEGRIERHAKDLAFRAGTGAGCEYFKSRVVGVGPDGPFLGGRWAWFFNPLYTHGHWALTHTGAFVLAWGAFGVMSRRDPERMRGVCAACGYPLAGFPRCPECGRDAPP